MLIFDDSLIRWRVAGGVEHTLGVFFISHLISCVHAVVKLLLRNFMIDDLCYLSSNFCPFSSSSVSL